MRGNVTMWHLEKRTQKFCSNQTMVGCDELTMNSIQVAAPALREHLLPVCTYLKPCSLCVLGMCEAIATHNGASQQLVTGLLLLDCLIEQVFLKP